MPNGKEDITLSVIMCNYNYASYVKYAIDGIVSQTLKPLELIIIDDASTDKSLELIVPYVEKYKWIKLYKNEINRGVCQSAQFGLECAKGDYVYFASSDDHILPEYIEKSLAALKMYPQAGLCCSVPGYFLNNQIWINKQKSLAGLTPLFISSNELVKNFKKIYQIAGHTSIYKKRALIEAGGIKEEMGHLCDWFFSQVIGYRQGVVFIPEVLATMRAHPEALSAKFERDVSKYVSLIRFLEKAEYQDVKKKFYHIRILNCQRKSFINAFRQLGINKMVLFQLTLINYLASIFKVIKKYC